MLDLSFGICGSITNQDNNYNPMKYCKAEEGKKLLEKLCSGPINHVEIDKEILDGLLLVEAVRLEGVKCFLNFPIFLKKDKLLIDEVTDKFAKYLSDQVKTKESRFKDLISKTSFPEVSVEKKIIYCVRVCLSRLERP